MTINHQLSTLNSPKDAPAFDFYAERWSHGTRHMSKVERADYLDLLIFQWTEQGVPGDLATVARILGYRRGAQIPAAVLEKFPLCADGKRRNNRLEIIRAEQRERIARRRVGAAKTNEKRWRQRAAGDPATAPEPDRERVAGDNANDNARDIAYESPPPTAHHPPPFESESHTRARPGQEQAVAAAGFVGVTEQEASDWWLAREASGWMKGTGGGGITPVGVNWQADLKTYTNAMREQRAREAHRHANAHRTPAPQRRDTGDLNHPERYA